MKISEVVKVTGMCMSSYGMYHLAGRVIVAVMPPQARMLTKVCVAGSVYMLSLVAAKKIDDFVEEQVDGAVEAIEVIKSYSRMDYEQA